jgi:hypothetical protein
MRKLVAPLIMLAFLPTFSASAGDKITGAFGLTLGAPLEAAQRKQAGTLTSGEPIYAFTPTNPVKYFQRYYVLISPKTQRVHEIWGMGPMYKDEERCSADLAEVAYLLEQKYGKFDDKRAGFDMKVRFLRSFTEGKDGIHLFCRWEIMEGYRLEVRYIDGEVGVLAKKERTEQNTKDADKKGL